MEAAAVLMASVLAFVLGMLLFASPAAHVNRRIAVRVLALGHALCACGAAGSLLVVFS